MKLPPGYQKGGSRVSWSPADDAIAMQQGWSLFACNSADVPMELQRYDEAEVFQSDDDAALFVYRKSLARDPVAVKALMVLNRESPAEYRRIMRLGELTTLSLPWRHRLIEKLVAKSVVDFARHPERLKDLLIDGVAGYENMSDQRLVEMCKGALMGQNDPDLKSILEREYPPEVDCGRHREKVVVVVDGGFVVAAHTSSGSPITVIDADTEGLDAEREKRLVKVEMDGEVFNGMATTLYSTGDDARITPASKVVGFSPKTL